MCRKILVPLDGSPLAEAVLPHAQAMARSEGAEIVLLRVAITPDPNFFHRHPAEWKRIAGEIVKEAQDYVKVEVARLQNEGDKVTGLACDGVIPDTILDVAEVIHADVIAMATHGRVGIRRLLMGSVAEQVVRCSHIPVMLIHPHLNRVNIVFYN